MFDTLTNKLQKVFKDLRGLGKITDENVAESLREVRMALLEADVNFKVARDFIDRVKEKSLGEEVIQRGPVHELHREVVSATRLSDLVDGDDARVVDPRRCSSFPPEAFETPWIEGEGSR